MKYVTITQLLEVGEGTVLAVHTHVLASDQQPGQAEKAESLWHCRTKSEYSWFNDKCNQELMASIHQVLCCNQLENLVAHSYQSKRALSPAYEFRRSEELRMLFTFKRYGYRQHIVIPDQSMYCQPLTPRASFISEHGKRVLPYLRVATFGSGYRSYRVLPDALHAFVDHFEVTSNKGIFKVVSLLDPKHKLSVDIISYFKSEDQGQETEEGLAQVPLGGLKQKSNKPGKGQRYGRTLRKNKRGQLREVSSSGQMNILKVFEKYKCSEQRSEEEMRNAIGDIDSIFIDEFFDFNSTQSALLPTKEESKDDPIANEGCGDDPVINDNHPIINEDNEDDPVISKGCRGDPVISDLDSGIVTMAESVTDKHVEKETPHKKQRLHSPTNAPSFPIVQKTSADSVIEARSHSKELIWDEYATDVISCIDINHASNEKVFDSEESDQLWKELCSEEKDLGFEEKDIASEENDQFEITDDDIDMALFDIKTPELLSQQESSSQYDLQSQTPHPPITKSKSLPTPTSFSANKHSEPQVTKSKSDSALQSPFLDDVTNTMHASMSECDTLTSGVLSVGDGGVSEKDMIDLTGECNHGIALASQSSQNEENGTTKQPNQKAPVSLKHILRGAKNVKDLSQKQVGHWIRFRKPIILDIFKRKVYSQRHEDYLSYPKRRAALVYQVDLRMFRKNQVDLINQCLLKIFCSKHGRYFSYVMSVLQPECLIRMIADVHGVDFNQAELMMFNYKGDSIDLTDSVLESD